MADKVGGADGTGSAVLFNSPVGIAVGPLNALYVCDTFNNTIRTGVHASGGGATGGVYAFSGATSLAYFGAKVLHPRTLAPLLGRRIPTAIRNTLRPDAPGWYAPPIQ